MELQLAVQSASRSNNNNGRSHTGNRTKKDVPNYLKPSTGSCHHACKYGGAHAFQEKVDAHAHRTQQPKPRKQTPPVSDSSLIRVRLVPRKLFSRANDKAARTDSGEKKAESVEWKDIVAYDTVTTARGGSLPELLDGGVEKKDAMMKIKGKKSHDKKVQSSEQVDGLRNETGSLDKKKPVNKSATGPKMITSSNNRNLNTDTKSVKKPPLRRGKKPPAPLVIKKNAVDQGPVVDAYQPLSPSLLQKRASLLRDLEEEMVHHEELTTTTNGFKPPAASSLDQEEEELAAAETSRPIPAHRRVKSMSISISSRSVRFPFARQASKNSSGAARLRSKSSKGPTTILLPSEEEKEKPPARLRSRRASVGGGDEIGGSTAGRGIQLSIRSLRRRGVGGSGGAGASAGFVVPAVALRHQGTLDKKRSQRLYNNLIEETASKLVKTRKSRVKALVGAFESVISKIAK